MYRLSCELLADSDRTRMTQLGPDNDMLQHPELLFNYLESKEKPPRTVTVGQHIIYSSSSSFICLRDSHHKGSQNSSRKKKRAQSKEEPVRLSCNIRQSACWRTSFQSHSFRRNIVPKVPRVNLKFSRWNKIKWKDKNLNMLIKVPLFVKPLNLYKIFNVLITHGSRVLFLRIWSRLALLSRRPELSSIVPVYRSGRTHVLLVMFICCLYIYIFYSP